LVAALASCSAIALGARLDGHGPVGMGDADKMGLRRADGEYCCGRCDDMTSAPDELIVMAGISIRP